jgi:hypothetical protein
MKGCLSATANGGGDLWEPIDVPPTLTNSGIAAPELLKGPVMSLFVTGAIELLCPRDEYLQRMSIFICSVFVRREVTEAGGLIEP